MNEIPINVTAERLLGYIYRCQFRPDWKLSVDGAVEYCNQLADGNRPIEDSFIDCTENIFDDSDCCIRKMKQFKMGDKVRSNSEYDHFNYPQYYPEVGTIGFIDGSEDSGAPWVQWPIGSTSGNDRWSQSEDNLELVTE